MATYNSIGTYTATSSYPTFIGLLQYGDKVGSDPRYAVEAVNMETVGGSLQPAAACVLMQPVLEKPIKTLARLYRRWYSGADGKEILVAASGGKLYAMLPSAKEWTELNMPDGVTAYQSDSWSWVSYEINPEGSDASVDVLLLSNALDGMVMVRGDTLTVSQVETPKKFGVIARYAERIWGGAITDDPDMLVYSAPYDPTDWKANVEIPEDGAGDINQPSWDGDSFTALRQFGSQLIAFKKTRIWRILGTDPGEYTFKEQYGGGAPYADTIAVDVENILMLTDQGVQSYDGLSASAYGQDYCRDIWARMNKDAMDGATAAMWRGKYYMAVPLDGSEINNAVIIYDTSAGTWLMRDDVSVEHFLPTTDMMYFTSATKPGHIWKWQENSWETGRISLNKARWVTPWNTLGYKQTLKGNFDVYLLVEVRNGVAQLNISVETEKKAKTKTYTIEPLTDEELGKGKHYKQKRLHFGGSGRMFRLVIESEPLSAPWRLAGGITVVSELDPD